MSGDVPITQAFHCVAELGIALGAHPLNKHAGCWTHQVDSLWWIAVNGHQEPHAAQSAHGMSHGAPFEVAPFSCYVEFNGWPAGYFDPFGGTFATGDVANEESFIAAVVAATARVAKPR